MAELLSVTTLPVGKLPPLRTYSFCCWSKSHYTSRRLPPSVRPPSLSLSPCFDQESLTRQEQCFPCPVIYHQCSRLCAGWQNKDVCRSWGMSPRPLLTLEKTLGNNEIWCCNIKVVEKAVFQWCYLSCSVLTPCNDDLSLFSVLCSIFIYDQASFSLYFFGFVTHFLCHTCN